MNRRTRIIIILVALTIVLLLLVSSMAVIFRYRKPETTVLSLNLIDVDEASKTFFLGLELQIFNSNNLKMEVTEIKGDVYLDDEHIGPIFNKTGVTVPARDNSVIELILVIEDPSLNVLTGEVLTIAGRSYGKYLWMEGSSTFEETMDLPGIGNENENLPPIAIIEAPLTAVVLEDVQFDGSNSWDPDGSIVEYNWDMGDGTQLEGDTVNHRYSSAGTYLVRLTVVDDLGDHDDATHRITVRLRF